MKIILPFNPLWSSIALQDSGSRVAIEDDDCHKHRYKDGEEEKEPVDDGCYE